MKNQYDKTIAACFAGYIVQAVVNNFIPLLLIGIILCSKEKESSRKGGKNVY